MSMGFLKNHFHVLRIAFLQLLLQVTTAMLVLAQAGNLTNEVLETGASKSVNWLVQSGMALAVAD